MCLADDPYCFCHDSSLSSVQLEGLASSAVRSAAKVNAALIIAFTITGRTSRMLAKYRPPMPILSVIFPRLRTDSLKWTFTGESEAHQTMISRGVFPMLADPSFGGAAEVDTMEGSMLSRAIAFVSDANGIKYAHLMHMHSRIRILFKRAGVFCYSTWQMWKINFSFASEQLHMSTLRECVDQPKFLYFVSRLGPSNGSRLEIMLLSSNARGQRKTFISGNLGWWSSWWWQRRCVMGGRLWSRFFQRLNIISSDVSCFW